MIVEGTMTEVAEKLNNQALLLAERGSYDDAIACLNRALTLEQDNYLLWYNLGITYRDAGKLSEAKIALEKAADINPDDEDTLDSLAILCFLMDESDESLMYCAEGLEINPQNPKFWNTSGVVYFNRQQYNDACYAFEQAVILNPYYYDAMFNLRDTYERLGNENGCEICNDKLKEMNKLGYN